MSAKLRIALLAGALSTAGDPSTADTLVVGQPLPGAKFLHVEDQDRTELATLSDVISDKTIVFVFASW